MKKIIVAFCFVSCVMCAFCDMPIDYATGKDFIDENMIKWRLYCIEGKPASYGCVISPHAGTAGEVTIPSHMDGSPVLGLYKYAFNNTEVTSVVLPEGLVEIGEGGFTKCVTLRSVTLPTSLTNIGDRAFFECTNLLEVIIPEGVREIRDECFKGCINLQSVSLPSTTTNIGSQTFSGCRNLSNLMLPEGLERIDNLSFSGCYNITDMTFPSSFKAIVGSEALGNCYRLTNVTFRGDAPHHDYNVFNNSSLDLIVQVPVGSKGWDGNPESTALPKYWPYNTEGGRRIVHIGETVNDEPPVVTNYVYSTVTNYIHTTVTNEVFHYSTVTNEVHHHTTDEIHHYSTVTNEVFHYMTVTNELFHYSTVTNEIQNHSIVTNVMHVYSTVTNVVEYVPEPGTSPDAGYTIRAGEDVVLTIAGAAGWDAFGVPDGMTWNRTTGKLSGCVRRSGIYDLLLLSGSGVDTRIMRTTITVTGGAGDEGDGDPLLEPIKIVGGDLVKGTMTFSVDLGSLPDFENGLVVIKQTLPTNVQFKVTGGKKLDAGKAALLKYQKIKVNGVDRYVLTGLDDASRPNVSGIKLTYSPKTGVIKGFFAVYASDAASLAPGVKPKLKKYKVAITGAVVNGVGIGQATMAKPAAGPWTIELR